MMTELDPRVDAVTRKRGLSNYEAQDLQQGRKMGRKRFASSHNVNVNGVAKMKESGEESGEENGDGEHGRSSGGLRQLYRTSPCTV
jgi:hypothetical protein